MSTDESQISLATLRGRAAADRDSTAVEIRALERRLREATQLWREKCIEYRFLCELTEVQPKEKSS